MNYSPYVVPKLPPKSTSSLTRVSPYNVKQAKVKTSFQCKGAKKNLPIRSRNVFERYRTKVIKGFQKFQESLEKQDKSVELPKFDKALKDGSDTPNYKIIFEGAPQTFTSEIGTGSQEYSIFNQPSQLGNYLESKTFDDRRYSEQTVSTYMTRRGNPKKLPPLCGGKDSSNTSSNHDLNDTSYRTSNLEISEMMDSNDFKNAKKPTTSHMKYRERRPEIIIKPADEENPQDSSMDPYRKTLQSCSGDSELANIHTPDGLEMQPYSKINDIVSKLKDEVKPMFIFSSKYKTRDSIGSSDSKGIMTPCFWQGKPAGSVNSSIASLKADVLQQLDFSK